MKTTQIVMARVNRKAKVDKEEFERVRVAVEGKHSIPFRVLVVPDEESQESTWQVRAEARHRGPEKDVRNALIELLTRAVMTGPA